MHVFSIKSYVRPKYLIYYVRSFLNDCLISVETCSLFIGKSRPYFYSCFCVMVFVIERVMANHNKDKWQSFIDAFFNLILLICQNTCDIDTHKKLCNSVLTISWYSHSLLQYARLLVMSTYSPLHYLLSVLSHLCSFSFYPFFQPEHKQKDFKKQSVSM